MQLAGAGAAAAAQGQPGAPAGGPKISLEMGTHSLAAGAMNEAGMRRIKQLGVDHVLMSGPRMPWQEDQLRSIIARLKEGGLTCGIMMIGGFPNTIYGKPGRDEEIEKVQQSIRAAGKAGLPAVEYNFYAHRAMEGYYEETGRAGAGLTAFDYDRMQRPAAPARGGRPHPGRDVDQHHLLPESRGARRRRVGRTPGAAPQRSPAPLSRGSGQIMGTLAGWKKLIEIVPSQSNGITFDCGVTREMGEDPVEVCRYFGDTRPHQPRALPQCESAQAL